MASTPGLRRRAARRRTRTEPLVVRIALIAVAIGFLALFLLFPLALVFQQAFAKGWTAWEHAVGQPDAVAAIRLTLLASGWRRAGSSRASAFEVGICCSPSSTCPSPSHP